MKKIKCVFKDCKNSTWTRRPARNLCSKHTIKIKIPKDREFREKKFGEQTKEVKKKK